MSKYSEDADLKYMVDDYFEVGQSISNAEKHIDALRERRRAICTNIESKLAANSYAGIRHFGENYVVVTRKQAKYLLPVQERKKRYKEIAK